MYKNIILKVYFQKKKINNKSSFDDKAIITLYIMVY